MTTITPLEMDDETTAGQAIIAHRDNSFTIDYTVTPSGNVNYALRINKDPLHHHGDHATTTAIPSNSAHENIFVIDSVYSGTGREDRDFYGTVVEPIFKFYDIKHEFLRTSSRDSVRDLAKGLKKDSTIVILSGDTSVSELINNVPQSVKLKLFPIPLGTGNALGHSLQIKNEFVAMETFLKSLDDDSSFTYKDLPVYKALFPEGSIQPFREGEPVSELYFLVVTSWCVHASLVYLAESQELKKYGVERFKIAAGQTFASDVIFHGDIRPDTGHKVHNYLNVMAVSNFEPTYKISPDSDVFKNELHLLDIGGSSRETAFGVAELGALLLKPYHNGAHIDPNDDRIYYKKVDTEGGVEITITNTNEFKSIFCVDGETVLVTRPNGKTVKVQYLKDSKRLNIKVPFIK